MREQRETAQEARLRFVVRRRVTGRLLPRSWSRRLASLLLPLLALTAIGCCGEVRPAPPVVVRPPLPALLPDERDEVLRRWGDVSYVGSEVRMPADLWRLVSRTTAAGWANTEALKRAGQWATQSR